MEMVQPVPRSTALRRGARLAVPAAWVLLAVLPLVGLVSLLLHSQLDPDFDNPPLHFTVFLIVGGAMSLLAQAAARAARRRGDARVLLLSLAFLATGLFLMVHAVGTPGVLFRSEYAGFHVAIPVGLLIAAVFGAGSAVVDLRPAFATWTIRHARALRVAVLAFLVIWIIWTIGRLPGLSTPGSEGASDSALGLLAILAAGLYLASTVRYLIAFRGRLSLLPASVIACFTLLAEAMVGVAVTGERTWHASWWEWHGLIVIAYLIILFAAQREWQEERFRPLYLAETRAREQDISVLFCDLRGYTTFAETAELAHTADMLATYYEVAAPLISRRFGGELEKFLGDGIMATFNTRGDQDDHAVRAAGAALALQQELTALAVAHPGWLRVRIGVNSGPALVRELGGRGYVAYAVIGDTVNVGSRLESMAPVGGVLIGGETRRRLPDSTTADRVDDLQLKGRAEAAEAWVLHDLPDRRGVRPAVAQRRSR